jgi:dienelactone hydrolase
MRADLRLLSASCFALLALATSCPQARPGGAAAGGAQANGALSRPAPAGGQSAAVGAGMENRVPPPAGAENVSLRTADGYTVAGWYWKPKLWPKQKLAPGVLLLHMRGKDKSSWGSLPETLLGEGYAVLAIDLRGHGETVDPAGRRPSLDALADSDYQAMLFDVGAGVTFLRQQPNCDEDRVGIIGASIGANLALLYAATNRAVRTVVCLSPGLNYHGLQPLGALDAYDKRPLYLIAAKDDTQSYPGCLKLQDAAVKAKPVSLRGFDGSDHGTALLTAHPGLDKTIVTGWLLNYLAPER